MITRTEGTLLSGRDAPAAPIAPSHVLLELEPPGTTGRGREAQAVFGPASHLALQALSWVISVWNPVKRYGNHTGIINRRVILVSRFVGGGRTIKLQINML